MPLQFPKLPKGHLAKTPSLRCLRKSLRLCITFPAGKVNTSTRRKIYSKLTIKTLKQRHWRRPGVFIVNFEHISHLSLIFLLLPLKISFDSISQPFKSMLMRIKKHVNCPFLNNMRKIEIINFIKKNNTCNFAVSLLLQNLINY